MRDADTAADKHGPSRHAAERRDSRNWSRRQALASLASAGTLALAGCSLSSVLPGVQPLWEHDFSTATAAGPPSATDDHVVVGGQDKRLHGFTADGERILSVETGGPIEAQPAVPSSGGPVHVYSTDGDLYTVGLSGERLWHVEGQVRNGWLGRHGSLLVAIHPDGGVVTGYDASDGTRRFQRPGRAYPYPTLSDSACLFLVTNSDDDTKLVTLAPATGEVLWKSTPRTGYPSVVAAGDRIVTVHDSTVRMRRVRDGHVLWRTVVDGDVTSYVGLPVWLGDHVYVRVRRDDRSDELVAIERDGGTVRWRRTVGYELETVTATSHGVFAASSVDDPDGGILIRLDAFDLDGTRRWQTTTDIAIGGRVEALGRAGVILFAASDNELAAYDPATGKRRWRYDPETSRIGVTTAAGALYVSYRDRGGVARLPTS
ncbi:outer membrane protein assembly factor BamB family protein [Natrinema altunense]|uniref:Pyrrolo-quinoline quinone n=1 Tax=Natrinema altunense (strain JCM 12890 / CGMCC 1.3731 / AJ2) TaxID=1227494 RepID=M0A3Q9_NATA2|nr:PQQ-binding-like beta-propeller repeat protein [Natrinema altunense]ELY91978.1 Pyrrolo-quinoline quinone [Natrinema altunense JCM 12890]